MLGQSAALLDIFLFTEIGCSSTGFGHGLHTVMKQM